MKSEIIGSSLTLKPLTSSNVSPNYLSWLENDNINRFLESRFNIPKNTDEILNFIENCNSNPNIHLYGIFQEGVHVGNIKLEKNPYHSRGDIGLIIGEQDYWGKGIASDAIKLISDWAFKNLALHKITAGAYSSNIGSIKAFKKNDFVVEAVLKEHCISSNGDRVDVVLLGKLKP